VIAMNGMRFFTSYAVIRSVIMAIGFCLLIRPLGIEGAALGVLSAGVVDIVYLSISLRKYMDVKFTDIALKSYAKPILLGMISASVIYYNRPLITDWLSFLLAGIVYSVLFLILGFAIKVLGEEEKRMIKNVLTRFLR